MSDPRHTIVDSALGTGAVLSPFWWPNSLEGWLQCILACMGIVLLGVRALRAWRRRGDDEDD